MKEEWEPFVVITGPSQVGRGGKLHPVAPIYTFQDTNLLWQWNISQYQNSIYYLLGFSVQLKENSQDAIKAKVTDWCFSF